MTPPFDSIWANAERPGKQEWPIGQIHRLLWRVPEPDVPETEKEY